LLKFQTLANEAPRALLQEFLGRHFAGFDQGRIESDASECAKAIRKAIADSPPGVRKRIEADLSVIEKLSSEAGQAAVQFVSFNFEFDGINTAVGRSLWLFLHDVQRREKALDRLFFDEHRTPRQWSAYDGPKSKEPKLDGATIDQLKAKLRKALDSANIHVEFFHFGPDIEPIDENEDDEIGQAIQFTVYSEDLPNAEPAFVEGELKTVVRSKVIQAAAIYDPVSGVIECVARRKQDREAIVREIGQVVFDVDPGTTPRPARRYDLTSLGKRRDLKTDPQDRIESVGITLLRLSPLNAAETVTLERASRSAGTIWDTADRHLGQNRLETQYRITRARLVIKYRRDGSTRLHALSVIITPPFGSNIKEQDEFERTVSQKYLTAWKLADPK
jgi:hypothetical protein